MKIGDWQASSSLSSHLAIDEVLLEMKNDDAAKLQPTLERLEIVPYSVLSRYSPLLPKDEEAFDSYNAFAARRLDEANKIGKIYLAATGKDLMDNDKQGDVTVDLYAALDMETDAVAERYQNLKTIRLEKQCKKLSEKIEQLNSAIVVVSNQLRTENTPNGEDAESDEVEALA